MENIDLISERMIGECLKDIREVKKAYPGRILIASIMASKEADWKQIAGLVEEAGADLIECSFSCPHGMPDRGMGSTIGQDAQLTLKTARWVKEAVKIPVLIKLTPNVTDMTPVARAVKESGCDGVTLINTVKTLMGINLETFVPIPEVGGKSTCGGYSGPAVKPIALRFISEIAKTVGIPISGVGGITTWEDAAEFFLCGAGTVQLCTAPMHFGFDIVEDLKEGLSYYLESKGIQRVSELVGKALPNIVSHEELSRDYWVVSRINKELCIKDDLCQIACQDGGHQAITMGEDRYPVVDEEKCVGCGLCFTVCPVKDCISYEKTKRPLKQRKGVAA